LDVGLVAAGVLGERDGATDGNEERGEGCGADEVHGSLLCGAGAAAPAPGNHVTTRSMDGVPTDRIHTRVSPRAQPKWGYGRQLCVRLMLITPRSRSRT